MYTEDNGVTISQMCYQCHALSDLCPDCLEEQDSRDIEIAHRLVEEGGDYVVRQVLVRDIPSGGYKLNPRTIASAGSLGEKNPPSLIQDYPSGHDWTERDEFLEPVSMLVDRLYDLETSLIITGAETICESCHLVYNKYAPCPNCN